MELILVNKENGIDLNYIPDDLVVVDYNENNFHNYVNPKLYPTVREEVLYYFNMLKQDASKDGFYLIIDSGFRSSKYQRRIFLYNYKKNILSLLIKNPSVDGRKLLDNAFDKTCLTVALPGYSEHQTGLAIDIACFRNGIYSDEITDSEEALWMHENAYKYGFILRYPKNKESITGFSYEPWHYRYVGTDVSKDFYDGDYLTLEEYKLIRK